MATQPNSWERCRVELQNIRAARSQDDLPELLRNATVLLDRLRKLAAGIPALPVQNAYIRDGRADVVRKVLEIRSALVRPTGADDEWEAVVAPFRERTLSEPLVNEFSQALARYTSAAQATTAEVEDLRKDVELGVRQRRLVEEYLKMMWEMHCCIPS